MNKSLPKQVESLFLIYLLSTQKMAERFSTQTNEDVRVHSPVAESDCEIASRDDDEGQFWHVGECGALESWVSSREHVKIDRHQSQVKHVEHVSRRHERLNTRLICDGRPAS